jgi:hypothetical protein
MNVGLPLHISMSKANLRAVNLWKDHSLGSSVFSLHQIICDLHKTYQQKNDTRVDLEIACVRNVGGKLGTPCSLIVRAYQNMIEGSMLRRIIEEAGREQRRGDGKVGWVSHYSLFLRRLSSTGLQQLVAQKDPPPSQRDH